MLVGCMLGLAANRAGQVHIKTEGPIYERDGIVVVCRHPGKHEPCRSDGGGIIQPSFERAKRLA